MKLLMFTILKRKLSTHLPSADRVLLLSVLLLPAALSCNTGNTEYTKCEEMCEYSRRDCIQNCGGYNSFGFSIDFGKSGFQTPYACTGRCEKISQICLERCGEKVSPKNPKESQ